jgi:hypothetical protein
LFVSDAPEDSTGAISIRSSGRARFRTKALVEDLHATHGEPASVRKLIWPGAIEGIYDGMHEPVGLGEFALKWKMPFCPPTGLRGAIGIETSCTVSCPRNFDRTDCER